MTEEKKQTKLEREKEIATKLNAFLADHSASIVPSLSFPMYNKLPVELELALAVIKKHDPQFSMDIVLKDEPQEVSIAKSPTVS